MVFDPWMQESVMELPGVDEAYLKSNGYRKSEMAWWSRSEIVHYDQARFYMVKSRTNPFGGVSTLNYGLEVLHPTEVLDPNGCSEQRLLHYRTARVWLTRDANRNLFALRFDELGMPLSVTVIDKQNSLGDSVDINSVEATVSDNPTAVITYDAETWQQNGTPNTVRIRQRELPGDNATPLRELIIYLDGVGNVMWRAFKHGGQWLIKDLVERDAHGQVRRSATPFYHSSSLLSEQDRADCTNSAKSFCYDGLGRLVRQDNPDGTFRSTRYGPWSTIVSDEQDTVLESEWYALRTSSNQVTAGDFSSSEASNERYKSRAAMLCAAHAKTPTVELLNALGETVVNRRTIAPQVFFDSVTVRNTVGLVTQRIVSGRATESVQYDLAGSKFRTESCESGITWYLHGPSKKILLQNNSDGRWIRYSYDAAARHTHSYFGDRHSGETINTLKLWGGCDDGAASRNQVNRLIAELSPAGLLTFNQYDVAGRPTSQCHYLHDGSVNGEHVSSAELLSTKADLLQVLAIKWEFDALGRPTRVLGPDGTVIGMRYGDNALLKEARTEVNASNASSVIARDIRYDSSNRIRSLKLGPDLNVRCGYDISGELVSVDAPNLNDVRIVRDATGRVVSITEANQLFSAISYDSLGEITKVEGVEPSNDNVNASSRTTLLCQRDTNGRLLSVRRVFRTNVKTKCFNYDSQSELLNSIVKTDGELETSVAIEHDVVGRILKISTRMYDWNNASQLVAIHDAEKHTHASIARSEYGSVSRVVQEHADGVVTDTVSLGDVARIISRQNELVMSDLVRYTVRVNGSALATLDCSRLADRSCRVIDILPQSLRAWLDGWGFQGSSVDGEYVTCPTLRPGRGDLL